MRSVLLSAAMCLLSFKGFSQDIKVDFSDEVRPLITVSVSDYPEGIKPSDFQKHLALFMIQDKMVSEIPVSGSYVFSNSKLQFAPANALGRGLEFEVKHFRKKDTITKRIKIPAANMPHVKLTEVAKFFPLSNVVPQNILRFHIQFSNKMIADENAFLKVDVLDENGEKIKMMWRQKSYWIADSILVMMIHPGRVKKGITNYSELGPMFDLNKKYTLTVSEDVLDKYHRKLAKTYKHTFTIGAPDTVIPQIEFEKIKVPKAGTKKPLEIVFNEGMDFVSVIEGIYIFDMTAKEKVAGKFNYTSSDKVWHFVPEKAWQANSHEIYFTVEVFDFAFNYLHRRFEITDLNLLNEGKMPMRWEFVPKK